MLAERLRFGQPDFEALHPRLGERVLDARGRIGGFDGAPDDQALGFQALEDGVNLTGAERPDIDPSCAGSRKQSIN